ncbi:hypothetical protein HRbin34_00342 [bacterium HR34]|nr:hypothetical protein HRbin34_00342 [bacterium HR34]
MLLKNVLDNNLKIFQKFFDKNIFFIVLLSFAVLVVVGFYRSFFPIFLEKDVSFSRETVLFFISLSSVVSLPISYLVLKFMSKNEKKNAILGGFFLA